MRARFLIWGALGALLCVPAVAQFLPRTLLAYSVTVSGTAVTVVAGPVNGCNITSTVALIIDKTGASAGTSASTTGQLQPANAAPFQCGYLGNSASVSVNCSGGGTCSWTGDRW
jgi:hypothetical protein